MYICPLEEWTKLGHARAFSLSKNLELAVSARKQTYGGLRGKVLRHKG